MLLQNADNKSTRVVLKRCFNNNVDCESMELKGTGNLWENSVLEFMQNLSLYQYI